MSLVVAEAAALIINEKLASEADLTHTPRPRLCVLYYDDIDKVSPRHKSGGKQYHFPRFLLAHISLLTLFDAIEYDFTKAFQCLTVFKPLRISASVVEAL